jgi:hypothetical protein
MPLKGVRYKVMTTKTGKKVRLAFRGRKTVVEAKNLATGATHTPEEFARERAQRRARGASASSRSIAARARLGRR